MLCWVAFGISVYSIFQVLKFDPILGNVSNNISPVTFFANNNLTGNMIAILSPLCLIFKDLRYKIIYGLCFIAILLTSSSLSLVAFVVGLFIYLISTKKWKLTLCLIVSMVIFVIYKKFSFFSDSGRFEIWKNTLGYCKDTLWLGKGVGNFAANQYKPLAGNPMVASPHNELLQILHDGGIFLLVPVMIYVLDLIRRIIISNMNILLIGFTSMFVSFIIISLGNFPMRIAPLALSGIVCIAAIEAILIKGEK